MNQYLSLSREVQEAKKNNSPIVALESTVITHGLPYPENLVLARKMEEVIRQEGAIPATIALGQGKIKIGLESDELEMMGQHKKLQIPCEKVSIRDIPQILMEKKWGGTTVAATVFACSLAHIPLFATGGIGGVHRQVEDTWDVSADLQALADYPVAVFCAGVKSILDIGKTLEYLETRSVPVYSFQTDDFPAFFSTKSGFKSPGRVNHPSEVAQLMKIKWEPGIHLGLGLDLGPRGGLLIARPIPEQDALDATLIDTLIEQSLKLMKKENISGKAVTPYLLKKIQEQTRGEGLKANISLLLNNAQLAAQTAVHYFKNGKIIAN